MYRVCWDVSDTNTCRCIRNESDPSAPDVGGDVAYVLLCSEWYLVVRGALSGLVNSEDM